MSLLEMDAVPGRVRYIWERMYSWMQTVFETYDYETYQVEGEDFDITNTRNYPLVTISLGTAPHLNETFGRSLPDTGVMVYYPFTIYVWDYHNDDPVLGQYYDIYILAERILKYLRGRRSDSTERDTHSIFGVTDLDMVESQPRGIRHVGRVIISGRIRSKREDNV